MSGENQNPELKPAALATKDVQKFFIQAAKYTVFAVFVLYSIGFIIWHSYLGTYGVSSIAFLQAEYLAAAFCYLFVLATFAIPPVLLWKTIMGNIREKGILRTAEWNRGWIFVVAVWFYLASRLSNILWTDSQNMTKTGVRLRDMWFGIIGLHLLLAIICGIKGGLLGKLKYGKNWTESESVREWRSSIFYRVIVRPEYEVFYTLGFLALLLFFKLV